MTVVDAKGVPVRRSGAKSRAKGRRFQVACQKVLADMGIETVARQCGEDGDDLVITTGEGSRWSLKLTDRADIPTGALGTKVDQATRQADGYSTRKLVPRTGLVWLKRRGRSDPLDGFIVIRAREFWERVA